MRRPRSTLISLTATVCAVVCVPTGARAQSCCAGGSAVTPGRLELHEDALVGMQVRAGTDLGSYDVRGSYASSPSGATEYDLEEDLFGAVRVLPRAQVALLIPLVETQRQTRIDGGHFGGGVGDINGSVRYDFLLAGESRVVPGIALLAGLTLPTGRPPESATADLLVDVTGVGAWQANVALALEQLYGPWLFNATGIVAKRTSRFGETLGTQFTLLAAGAYSFSNGAALSLSVSYAFEGDATATGGADVPDSAKHLTTATLSGLWPLDDKWRLLGGLFVEPPISGFGKNQPTVSGLTLTIIRSWS